MDSVLEELRPILQDIFDEPDLVITRESSASNVRDWDSLAHVNLVTAVGKHFKVRFTLGELQAMKNVGDMVDLIHAKRGAKK